MLQFLLGPDDFTKTKYIETLSNKQTSEVCIFYGDQDFSLEQLVAQDLFSKQNVFVLKDCFTKIDWEKYADKFANSRNIIIFVETKLDKRVSQTKILLSRKDILVKDFILPHGKELDAWIVKFAKELEINISVKVASLLAERLGRDQAKEMKVGGKTISVQEIFNLWEVENELKKIAGFVGKSGEVTEEIVNGLVALRGEVDTLSIADALSNNNKNLALKLIDGFLQTNSSAEEKGKIIQLNALLSEQFRNIFIVLGFVKSGKTDAEILEKTGWKSGRLFVVKKIALKFEQKKILELLSKLEALDQELKSSNIPPRVLLGLIVSQI